MSVFDALVAQAAYLTEQMISSRKLNEHTFL